MGRKRKRKQFKKKIKTKTTKISKGKVTFDEYPKNVPYKSKLYKSNNEVKIKKILKQPTEKKNYNIKDYVVYPKHGVGKIIAVEKATIGQIDIQFYKIFIEKEKLTLTVPINQQLNLRPISTINQINKCISILKTKPKINILEIEANYFDMIDFPKPIFFVPTIHYLNAKAKIVTQWHQISSSQ